MPSQKICLTGGAGFIGSHLYAALVAAGHEVVVIDDLSSGRRENLPPDADLRIVDVRSPEARRIAAEEGFDILVHQAAQMDVRRSVSDPLFDAGVNVLGSLNLLEAAREGTIRRVLFASTGGAIYGEQEVFPAAEDHPTRPVSPYGVAKLAVEKYLYYYCTEHGLDGICLRYGNVYGERQSPHGEAGVIAIFLDRLLRGETVRIHGDGLQTRDYIHVSDVVGANLAALELEGFQVYNVGTGQESTVLDLHRLLCAALETSQPAEHGPPKLGEQRRSVIESSALRRLGVAEPLALEEGLERTARWFGEHRADAG